MVENELVNYVQFARLPAVNVPRTSSSQSNPFKCLHCLTVFETEQDLSFHCFSDQKFIACLGCDCKFLTLNRMKQHFGKKHVVSRPYKCLICLKKFRNVHACRIHKQQVHFHTARKVCEFCGKSVFNKFSLKRHLSTCDKIKLRLNRELGSLENN